MSYNGIGLQTARGSGTSGYVQRSLASNKEKDSSTPLDVGHHQRRQLQRQHDESSKRIHTKAQNKSEARADIDQHNRKRQIEIRCMELRDELEDDSEDEDIIQSKVSQLRASLTAALSSSSEKRRGDSSQSGSAEPISESKRIRLDQNAAENASNATKNASTNQANAKHSSATTPTNKAGSDAAKNADAGNDAKTLGVENPATSAQDEPKRIVSDTTGHHHEHPTPKQTEQAANATSPKADGKDLNDTKQADPQRAYKYVPRYANKRN